MDWLVAVVVGNSGVVLVLGLVLCVVRKLIVLVFLRKWVR